MPLIEDIRNSIDQGREIQSWCRKAYNLTTDEAEIVTKLLNISHDALADNFF
jgi:hypothetical protein